MNSFQLITLLIECSSLPSLEAEGQCKYRVYSVLCAHTYNFIFVIISLFSSKRLLPPYYSFTIYFCFIISEVLNLMWMSFTILETNERVFNLSFFVTDWILPSFQVWKIQTSILLFISYRFPAVCVISSPSLSRKYKLCLILI